MLMTEEQFQELRATLKRVVSTSSPEAACQNMVAAIKLFTPYIYDNSSEHRLGEDVLIGDVEAALRERLINQPDPHL